MKSLEEFCELKRRHQSPLDDPKSITSQLLFCLFTPFEAHSKYDREIDSVDLYAKATSIAEASRLFRISPTVEIWLQKFLKRPFCDEAVALFEQLRRINFQQKAINRLLLRTYRQVSEALTPLPHLFIKGLAVGYTFYGSADYRSTADIDVLVAPSHTYDALQALMNSGYAAVRIPCQTYSKNNKVVPTAEMIVQAQRLTLENNILVQHPGTRTYVGLHWAPSIPTNYVEATEDFLLRRILISMSDAYSELLPVMSPSDQAFTLWYHFYNRCGFLKGLIDITCALDQLSIENILDLRGRFSKLGVLPIYDLPLILLRELHLHSPKLNTLFVSLDLNPLSLHDHAMLSLAQHIATLIPGLLTSNSQVTSAHPLIQYSHNHTPSSIYQIATMEISKIMMMPSLITQGKLLIDGLQRARKAFAAPPLLSRHS